jgi:hypothetical protein
MNAVKSAYINSYQILFERKCLESESAYDRVSWIGLKPIRNSSECEQGKR